MSKLRDFLEKIIILSCCWKVSRVGDNMEVIEVNLDPTEARGDDGEGSDI